MQCNNFLAPLPSESYVNLINSKLKVVRTDNGFSGNFRAIKPAGEMNREFRYTLKNTPLESILLKNTILREKKRICKNEGF